MKVKTNVNTPFVCITREKHLKKKNLQKSDIEKYFFYNINLFIYLIKSNFIML